MDDYESCSLCGYDHEYEPAEARKWHMQHKLKVVSKSKKSMVNFVTKHATKADLLEIMKIIKRRPTASLVKHKLTR